MSFDAIKPLLESGIINEETHQAISEAWESKLTEAREQVRAELREEFAQKYNHDREVMVEALDKMVTTHLAEEIAEFQSERAALNEDRVRAQQKLRENASRFNDFMVTKLADEIRELRSDRISQRETMDRLQQFVVEALAREIKDFAQDKRAVVEARVRLVQEGRKQLTLLKRKFVSENASRLKSVVSTHLESEIGQLKEDIKVARENDFGRRIFESFAGEYSASHLNEGAEVRRLQSELKQREQQLQESAQAIDETKKLVEAREREVRIIKESTQREKIMGTLLKSLNAEKASVMRDLLESVQTPRLQAAFDKYLPAVLNGGKPQTQPKAVLSEAAVKEVTGDKSAKVEVEVEGRDNVIDLKRLAGL